MPGGIVHLELGAKLEEALTHGALGEEARLRQRLAEEDIGLGGHRRNDRQLLVDRGDPRWRESRGLPNTWGLPKIAT